MNLLDKLEIAPAYKRNDDMEKYEFFECDYCGSVCRMDFVIYKIYFEPSIDQETKYRCRRCARMENRRGRPRKQPTEPVKAEQAEQAEQKNNVPMEEDTNEDKHENQLRESTDMVNHPPHYTAGGIECIDAILAAVEGLTPQEAVLVGNVMKYVWRHKRKNGKQDLLKAKWYLSRLIDEYNH